MEQAIKDYLSDQKISANRALRKQAEYWFERREEDLFSFAWCCRHLDIDPDRTLGKIKKATLASFRKSYRIKEEVA